MSVKIVLNNVAQPPVAPPPVTDIRLGNNVIVEISVGSDFAVQDIIDYVDTNGLSVNVTEIIIFTNTSNNDYAIFKKGAGVYDSIVNPIVEADLFFRKGFVDNNTDTYGTPKATHHVTLTQAEFDAIVTKDENTLYFIPLIP